jgi:replication-associated recombination protein RarA
MGHEIKTIRGYALLDVASALQKAIRRADAKLAGYWTIELFESNFKEYLWRRLLTISAEDCAGLITYEVESLYHSWQTIDRQKKGAGRIFAAKAAILLAETAKCRDADHLTNLIYDRRAIDPETLDADLRAAREGMPAIPDYAYDCHTRKGKSAGMTKEQFFHDEHAALSPRVPGLFDDLVP